MRLIFLILVVALPLWALWSAARSKPIFVIRIAAGVPLVSKGKVTREFLQDVAEVCSRHGVRQAVVRGVEKGDRISLNFSNGIPEPCRQQLRNLWYLSGWSAAPGRRHS